MWVRLYSSQLQFILLSAFVLAPLFSAPETFAQEGEAGTVVEKSARERELRERLQKILHELEELQQQPPSGTPAYSTACQAVGSTSDKNRKRSSGRPSGTLIGP